MKTLSNTNFNKLINNIDCLIKTVSLSEGDNFFSYDKEEIYAGDYTLFVSFDAIVKEKKYGGTYTTPPWRDVDITIMIFDIDVVDEEGHNVSITKEQREKLEYILTKELIVIDC